MSALRLGALRISESRVKRPCVLLSRDEFGEQVAAKVELILALAVCCECGHRPRVQPSNMLPYKRYGLDLMVALMAAHTAGNKSLRKAVWYEFTGESPSHTTLHAWTEGLGAHLLGRPFGSQPGASPFSAVLAATGARWPTVALTTLPQPPIDPRRHRSEERRERLVAIAGVLKLAASVLAAIATPPSKAPATNSAAFCEWRRLAVEFGSTAPLAFRTGIERTPIEQSGSCGRQSPGPSKSTKDPTCQARNRSPPGDSNRSLPSSTPPSTSPSGEA